MRKILAAIPLTMFLCLLSRASEPAARPAEAAISEAEAAARAARVSDVHYRLSLALDAEAKDFSGTSQIDFQLKDTRTPLTIDFAEGQVSELVVNGATLKPDYNGFFVTVPGAALRAGANQIKLKFTHPYSRSGSGFYRFKDPEDGTSYVYTDFEPYRANQLFPCFDQPDLKAAFRLQVEAPKAWTVISAARESAVRGQGAQRRLWDFPETASLSTYVFSLHAGPFKAWQAQAGAIPLRLFARRSLAKWVDSREWFETTRQGLAFYQKEFGYAYPFKKYDQVLVPDFNEGAMENAGAVTFTEGLVSRGPSTREDRRERANTILHEMAHMWFGDLVTMKWWNDLWLNESFATYLASRALDEGLKFPKTWPAFYVGTKNWAYWEDQLVTTHPIEALVPSTKDAFANFDGITYGKGAASLKQLAFFLGPDKFREGVRRYFKRHAFGNARREDFMQALAESSGKNLDAWAQEWLRTEGVNTIEASFECVSGKTAQFKLRQSAEPEHPTLRSHRTVIGFYATRDGHVTLSREFAINYAGAETPLPALNDLPCPQLVFPNSGDQDYVKVRLDARTVKAARSSLNKIADPLARMMFWEAHWDMVRAGQLPLATFGELALANLPTERDEQIAGQVLGYLHSIHERYLPRSTAEERARHEAFVTRIEGFLWKNLARAKPGSDLQKLWFDEAVTTAQTTASLDRLQKALTGQAKWPGLVIDVDRRWTLVKRLNRFQHPQAAALLETEKKRDPSNEGNLQALTAETLRPLLDTKEREFKRLTQKDNGLKLAEAKAVMHGLFPPGQEELRAGFGDRFYAALAELEKTHPDAEFTRPFAASLVPDLPERAAIQKLGDYIKAHADFEPAVIKSLRIDKQEAERTLQVRLANGMASAADLNRN